MSAGTHADPPRLSCDAASPHPRTTSLCGPPPNVHSLTQHRKKVKPKIPSPSRSARSLHRADPHEERGKKCPELLPTVCHGQQGKGTPVGIAHTGHPGVVWKAASRCDRPRADATRHAPARPGTFPRRQRLAWEPPTTRAAFPLTRRFQRSNLRGGRICVAISGKRTSEGRRSRCEQVQASVEGGVP